MKRGWLNCRVQGKPFWAKEKVLACLEDLIWVADGTRTHNIFIHSEALCH